MSRPLQTHGSRVLATLALVLACGPLGLHPSGVSAQESLGRLSGLDDLEPAVTDHLRSLEAALKSTLQEPASPERTHRLAGRYGELGEALAAYAIQEQALFALEQAANLDPSSYQHPYYLGLVAQQTGNNELAIDAFQRALELNPGYHAALIRLGQVHHARGELDLAAQRFREASAFHLQRAAALEGLAQLAFEAGSYEEAAKLFEQTLELSPESNGLFYPLALSYQKLGQTDRARALLRERGNRKPAFEDPLSQRLPTLSRAANGVIEAAVQASANGSPREALSLYKEALRRAPEHPSALRGIASTLSRLDKKQEALEAWRRYLERNPQDPLALSQIGSLQADLGFEVAQETLELALSQAPDLHAARLRLAQLFIETNRPALAKQQLETLTKSESTSVRGEAHFRLGQLANNRSNHSPETNLQTAFEQYQRAAELLPEEAAVALAAARTAGGLERHEDAVLYFERALRVDPRNQNAWFGGTLSLLVLGKFQAAAEWLKEGRETLAESVALLHLQTRFLATVEDPKLRRPLEALHQAKELVSRYPSPDHAETLAMAFAANNDFTSATLWADRALSALLSSGAENQGKAISVARSRLEAYQNQETTGMDWIEVKPK